MPDRNKADRLDEAILAAHAINDSQELAQLYAQAAEFQKRKGDLEAAGFLRTQALVFALECGHPSADALQRELAAEGREANV